MRDQLRNSQRGLNVRVMIGRGCLAMLCLLGGAPRAWAWGKLGHEAIGTVASGQLHEKARLRVKKILGTDDLSDACVWLDEVRAAEKGRGALANNAEAAAFNQKFPDNHKWHFVNLPLDSAGYSHGSKFAANDDIVHTLERAVAALEGRSRQFTPAQALRIVAHLVGDLHQPLHVGTGYYDVRNPDAPKLIINPRSVTDKPDDLGGNKIQVGRMAMDTLHAYWDTTLVEAAGGTGNEEKLATKLRSLASAARWASPGDYHAWAALWASDTVHEAEFAYRGITFKAAKLTERKSLVVIEAELAADYEKIQRQRAQVQLAKAAFHLAELLNAIDWKVP